ncbi:MAG TPA: hypothetical protein VGP72_26740 [Planctomycetota bacterium]|jgi:hypothetical protein
MRTRLGVVLALVSAASLLHSGETITCPDKADVWLSSANSEEKESNGGKSPRIKLKIYQEFGLLDFDVSALKGKRIEKAELHVAPAEGAIFGKDRGTDLRWFTFSTVSSPWVEGEGTSYTKDEKGHGATFNEASYKTRPWSFPGSKVWDVMLGNGKTLRCDSDGGDPKDGWFTIPIDKRLVEALVSGTSYGFLIMDGSTGVDRNSYIHSRESKKAPYLTVTVAGDDKTPSVVAASLKFVPSISDASPQNGAGVLSLTVPEKAFAYDIKLNGQALPRWQVPFAEKPGTTQSILFDRLPPDADVKFDIAVIDAAGNVSPVASVVGRSSPKATAPSLPIADWQPKGGTPPQVGGKLKVWAFPEICKLDPLTGKIVLEEGVGEAASKNSVWDAADSTVRIAAARGEIAGFQIAAETLAGPVEDLKIEVVSPAGVQARLWRTWFVNVKGKWQAEYALPLATGAAQAIPSSDNSIPEQKATAIAVDLIVPADAKAGESSGTITISAGGAQAKLSLKLKVYDATIPAEIHFNPELNAYSGPGKAGSEQFFDSMRLAHYHRCSINRVPHSHQGTTHEDWTPQVGPDGKVTDWSRFDTNLGPLLDGSAFKNNPRAGVPVAAIYLPLNESWPLPIKGNYHPGCDTSGKTWKAIHDIKAKPPEEAFPQSYKDAFVNCSADFARHFAEKGWKVTRGQCFFNNKHQYGRDGMTGTAWMMDEPNEYLDWHALNFYSRMFHAGLKAAGKDVPLCFRADVSRPMWQGSVSDGLMEMMYVGGEVFNMPALIKDSKRRMPTTVICYGGANDQSRANHESAAWCIKSYVYECDGVVPWQGLGGDNAFDKGDNPDNGNALIVDAQKRFKLNAVASYRVHAFRNGAQIAELLRLLEQKNGWGRAHSGLLVAQALPLSTEFKQAFNDDAAAVTFRGLSGDAFVRLKEGILKLLAK